MGQFHGKYKQPLKVIGVRKSAGTSWFYDSNSKEFDKAVKRYEFLFYRFCECRCSLCYLELVNKILFIAQFKALCNSFLIFCLITARRIRI